MDAFGWAWEYIDEEMTLPRFETICSYWKRIPPVSVSIAAVASAFGAAPKKQDTSSKAKKSDGNNLQSLVEALGGMPGFTVKTGG